MYEVACPNCSASFEYTLDDYIHLCPFCSSGFILDFEEGTKDLIGDHFIVPNQIDKEQVEEIFRNWLKERYHRSDLVDKEFSILGVYGISLPFWVVSLEAHTFWSGYSQKAKQYPGQSHEYGARFLPEQGHFSRRYRWAILARRSPKEHWGMERLHSPRERVLVDWDGFPFDETLGTTEEGVVPIYDAKMPFRFEHANGLTVSSVQIKEQSAIARARDQVQEYHRRIAKTKVGTLYEHRTEIEVVGIHLVHVPFWFLRYAYTPKSFFKFFTTVRERRMVIQGYSKRVLEAELPLNNADKVMTNLFVCGSLAFFCLALSVFLHPLFFLLFTIFLLVCILSAWKLFGRENMLDPDLRGGAEKTEPV